ncbi:MAG: hypothetical protein WD735_03920 [Balneolaceae bacterium]
MTGLFKILRYALLLFVIISSQSFAQNQEGLYMHFDYLNIDKDQIQSFRNQVTSTFRPIQEARIENESINGWYLYRVTYPGTQTSTYNYVVITSSENLSGFEDIDSQISAHIQGNSRETIMKNYDLYLNPNHSELWRVNNSVIANENSYPSRYIRINFMEVSLGREYEYQMFEDEIAKPLHLISMDNDDMSGWELFQLIAPGGTQYGYNFSTLDYYSELEDLEFGFTEELIRQNNPDTNINDFFENVYDTRDLVRSEVWELIDHIE